MSIHAMKQALEALGQSIQWQKAALECKDWQWDSDQREAAQGSLEYAIEQHANLRAAIIEAERVVTIGDKTYVQQCGYLMGEAERQGPTNEELTAIYNNANGIEGKNPPITTGRIFTAMRAMLAAPKPEK